MQDLTQGNEAKRIFFFALPMLIGNVFQQGYNLIDAAIVGNFVGTNALAAVGAAFPILFLVISLVIGITMGMNVVIAQYFGAKDEKRLRAAVDTSFITLLVMGIVLSVVGLLISRPLLLLLATPPEVLDMASVFLTISFAGMLAPTGYNMIASILQGLGDSRTPLYALILSTLVTIGLDLLFVVVFKWGVAGTAAATVIAQGVSFLIVFVYLNRTHEVLRLNLRTIRFDREIFFQGLRIGLPNGFQQMLVALGAMVLIGIVDGFGANALAGYSTASRLDQFAMMPAMNVGMALSTFTGQNIGAGKMDRVMRGFHAGLLITILLSVTISLVVVFLGRGLMLGFTTDGNVIAVGARYLLIVGSFYTLFGIMFATNGVIRGAGEAMVPMLNTVAALWIIRVPAALFFSKSLGTDGIWWSIPAGWVVGAGIAVGYYLSGRWKGKGVVNRGKR